MRDTHQYAPAIPIATESVLTADALDAVASTGADQSNPESVPTPRTDAEIIQPHTGDTELCVPADFARQLERELAEANRKIADFQDSIRAVLKEGK